MKEILKKITVTDKALIISHLVKNILANSKMVKRMAKELYTMIMEN